ncbi:MAG: calcium-binding protein [Pseudomonadota bacterium]
MRLVFNGKKLKYNDLGGGLFEITSGTVRSRDFFIDGVLYNTLDAKANLLASGVTDALRQPEGERGDALGDFLTDEIDYFDHALIKTSAADDVVRGDPELASFYHGGDGDDTLISQAEFDRLFGGRGNDTLSGGTTDQTSAGFFANDGTRGVNVNLAKGTALDTYGDTDTLINITIVTGTDRNDRITGDDEDNELYSYDGNDRINGGGGDDLMSAGNGNDRLNGGAGDDEMYGGVGKDRLNGGSGDDILQGFDGKDRLSGGDGDDEILSGSGNDISKGGDGEDLIFGNSGKNTLRGGNDDDEIVGGDDGDKIFGDAGDDRMWGMQGNDTLTGGAGDDDFIFFRDPEVRQGNDVIKDYTPGDDTIILANGYLERETDISVVRRNGEREILIEFSDGSVRVQGDLEISDLTIEFD